MPQVESINAAQVQQNRGLRVIKRVWPRLYFAKAYHRTTRDEPLTFRDKPWLKAIYKDDAKTIVIQKCIQIGITEYALCSMFTLAEQGRRGMYLLPDDDWRATFVTDRVDGLLNRCPKYKAAITAYVEGGKEADNKQIKNIFGRAWKFAGTNAKTSGSKKADIKKPKAAFEFQASVLILDEYDEHEQENLSYFYDRLGDEVDPMVFLFGNPTITGTGINREFMKSDQKYWHVECLCGHDQVLDWYKHFVRETGPSVYELKDEGGNPVCEKCGKAFDRCGKGRWIAHNPSTHSSGYAVSRLFVYRRPTDIKELFAKFVSSLTHSREAQNFHNNWMGIPYENTSVKLTEPLLDKAVEDLPTLKGFNIGGNLTLVGGGDTGRDKHIRLSEVIKGVRFARFIGVVKGWDDLEDILKEYCVGPFVVDAQGDGYQEVRDFVMKDPGNRWMCYYNLKDNVNKPYILDDETQVVRTNRTEILDTGVDHFKRGLIKHPGDWASILNGDYRRHLLAPVRVTDPTGRPIWTKPTSGGDHLFHATLGYETLAMLISGMKDSYRASKANWLV